MKQICIKCEKLYGEKPPLDDRSTTHGICPACSKRILRERKLKERKEYSEK